MLPYNHPSRPNVDAPLTDTQVTNWLAYRQAYKDEMDRWMDDNNVDAVVYPGFISDLYDNDSDGNVLPGSDRGTNVPTSNVGLPTAILPVGTNPDGDSISMQIVGRAWDDAHVLGYGYPLEQQTHGQQTPRDAPPLTYEAGVTPRPVVIDHPAPPATVVTAPAPTPPAVKKPVAKPTLTVRVGAIAKVSKGAIRLALRNAGTAEVTGTVTVRTKLGKRTVVLGGAKVSVVRKHLGTIVVKLSAKVRKELGKRTVVFATTTWKLKGATGGKATKQAKVTIRLR